MPLSSESKFGVRALTEAVNRLPVSPTQVRDLGIFLPRYLTTTHVDVELQNGELKLINTTPRGTEGEGIADKTRSIYTFNIPHLSVNDVVRADDVQNVRAFGGTQAETVAQKVEEKLADGKLSLEMTREHMQLGALLGKVLDADGTEIVDIYKAFGLRRKTYEFDLANAATEVGRLIDETVTAQRKLLKGAAVSGYVALCSPEFMMALKYHPKVQHWYERYRDGALYREADINRVEFEHNGIKFIQYDGDFGSGRAGIEAGKAILLPLSPRLYMEFFAPADMNQTVNTIALPYYASREKLTHDKGWSLHMQSNPLPLVMRPELVCTLAMK